MTYIKSTNYIKRDGMLSTAPKFVIEVNGSQFGSSCFGDLNDIDYRFYREFGWDWEKKEEIKVKVIDNISGQSWDFTWKLGVLQEKEMWTKDMFKVMEQSSFKFEDALRSPQGEGYYSYGDQGKIRENIILNLRKNQL